MIWILLGVCIAAFILGTRLFRLKRQFRNITVQLNERTSEKTEKMVTVALIDDDLNKLAAAINRNLELQKKLRIEVRRSDLQLKDSIANLSHDLRTPLTSILGYLQLSQNPECPDEKRKEYLKTVDNKAHALKSMINNLYELSVLDVRETPLKTEKLDLNRLLGDVLAGQYELFHRLGITLNVHLPSHPVWITGDCVACTRIIQNLLNNASRYAKGNVGISLEASGSYAFLSIRNPAPNLKANDIKHLFERFYTADKSRNSSGSGLGLYIVKTLIEKMNGKIADVTLEGCILHMKIEFPLALN
ncbi:sensor histidine kinase [Caproicibacter fermentans]|uniref:histidine kinase n=1 Tax=Caproicibacter fermentans TaxID=2576756 RepID=A0A7G8TBG6_9FIRM|nr:HAMP domain-containing sensor histidine kinase [Caproicibacter fermentans]QNK40957.1 HAMP domain-containing histidine kinase [Caproicibacter fermentans]